MNVILVIAAVNGFLVVLLGAFGAHSLEAILSPDRLEIWHTAVQYHMFHTAGLFGTGLLVENRPAAKIYQGCGQLFLAGILLFSGSLYLLAVTGASWLGMVTPAGGLAFLGGWGLLALGFWKRL